MLHPLSRSHRANTWGGCWTPGNWARDYVFSIEDPFDPFDNPARAVRSGPTKRAGQARRIANALSEAAAAIRRFKQFRDSSKPSSSSSQHVYYEDMPAVTGHVCVGAEEGVGTSASPEDAAAAAAGHGGGEDAAAVLEENGSSDGEEGAAAAENGAHMDEQEEEGQQQQEEEEEGAAAKMAAMLLDLLPAANAAADGCEPRSSAAVLSHAAAAAAAAGVALSRGSVAAEAESAITVDGMADELTKVQLTVTSTSSSTGGRSSSLHEGHLDVAVRTGGCAGQEGGMDGKAQQQQQQQQGSLRLPAWPSTLRVPAWPTTQKEALCKCLVELFGPQLVWRLGCCRPAAHGDATTAAAAAAAAIGGTRGTGAAALGIEGEGAAGGGEGVMLLGELFKPQWLRKFEEVVKVSRWTEPSLGLWMLATLAGRKPNQLPPKQAPQQQKQPAQQQQQQNGKVGVQQQQRQQAGSSSGGQRSTNQQQQQQEEHGDEGHGADGAEGEGEDTGSGPRAEVNHIRNIMNSVLKKVQIRALYILGLKQQGDAAAAAAGNHKRKFKLVLPTAIVQQPQKHGLPQGFNLPGVEFTVVETKSAAFEALTVMAADWVVQDPRWRQLFAAKKRLQQLQQALESYRELVALQQEQHGHHQQQQQPPQRVSGGGGGHVGGQNEQQQSQQQPHHRQQQHANRKTQVRQQRPAGPQQLQQNQHQQQQQEGRPEAGPQGSRQGQSTQQSNKPRKQNIPRQPNQQG